MVSDGYYNLGAVSHALNDLSKADMLVRESLRIRVLLYGNNNEYVKMCTALLANILLSQGNLGSETEELLKHSLAIDVQTFGTDGLDTATSHGYLGKLFHLRTATGHSADVRKKLLRLSKSEYMEALRIYTGIFGPDHTRSKQISSKLIIVNCELRLLKLMS